MDTFRRNLVSSINYLYLGSNSPLPTLGSANEATSYAVLKSQLMSILDELQLQFTMFQEIIQINDKPKEEQIKIKHKQQLVILAPHQCAKVILVPHILLLL